MDETGKAKATAFGTPAMKDKAFDAIHLLMYLFAMLIPVYDANLGSIRDALAPGFAFLFIVFRFCHPNLHYRNLLFGLFEYGALALHPASNSAMGGRIPVALLMGRVHLNSGDQNQRFVRATLAIS